MTPPPRHQPAMTPYDAIRTERERQEALYADGVLPMIASRPECPDGARLAALAEEVGEVGRALLDGGDVRRELVQVAAVAVAWIEGMEA